VKVVSETGAAAIVTVGAVTRAKIERQAPRSA